MALCSRYTRFLCHHMELRYKVFMQTLSLFCLYIPLDFVIPRYIFVISADPNSSSKGCPLPPPTKLHLSQYYCVSDYQLRLNIVYIIYLHFQLILFSLFPYDSRYHYHRLQTIINSHLSQDSPHPHVQTLS